MTLGKEVEVLFLFGGFAVEFLGFPFSATFGNCFRLGVTEPLTLAFLCVTCKFLRMRLTLLQCVSKHGPARMLLHPMMTRHCHHRGRGGTAMHCPPLLSCNACTATLRGRPVLATTCCVTCKEDARHRYELHRCRCPSRTWLFAERALHKWFRSEAVCGKTK